MQFNSEQRRQVGLLEWLDLQPQGFNDVAAFYGDAPGSFDLARSDLQQLRDAGSVQTYFAGGMIGTAQLTPHGRVSLGEIQHLRGNRGERRWACRTGMVKWLEHQGADSERSPTTWNGFAEDDLGDFYGQHFTEEEIDTAAAWLREQDLIDGRTVGELAGPVSAYLTSLGLECVEAFGADVRRYDAARRQPSPSITAATTHITIIGGNTQIATADGVTQTMEVHAAVDVVRFEIQGLVEMLRMFGVAGADQLETLYEEIVSDATTPNDRVRLLERFTQRGKELAGKVSGDARAAIVAMAVSAIASNAHTVISALH